MIIMTTKHLQSERLLITALVSFWHNFYDFISKSRNQFFSLGADNLLVGFRPQESKQKAIILPLLEKMTKN